MPRAMGKPRQCAIFYTPPLYIKTRTEKETHHIDAGSVLKKRRFFRGLPDFQTHLESENCRLGLASPTTLNPNPCNSSLILIPHPRVLTALSTHQLKKEEACTLNTKRSSPQISLRRLS